MSEDYVEFNNLLENGIKFISKDVKREEGNIRKLLHVGLSAYTDDPSNAVVLALSSEGKSWLANHVFSHFPKDDTLIVRSVSAKTFTRERGEKFIPNPDSEIPEEERYINKIKNDFTGEMVSVEEYEDYLKGKLKASKKDKEDGRENTSEIKKALSELKAEIVTVVDFRNKIVVFLEDIPKEIFKELQSMLSHDAYWTLIEFVEGEGFKVVKKVVFRGWPAVIFCTSKDTALGWRDLNTRFEIVEPNQSTLKYLEAMELSADKLLGEVEDHKTEEREFESRLYAFISLLKEMKLHVRTPFDPKLLVKLITKPRVGSAMRYFAYFLKHIQLETLWHWPNRVEITTNKGETFVLTSKDDLNEIIKMFFGGIDILAMMNGISTSDMEFYLNVLLDLQNTQQTSQLKSKDIMEHLNNYVKSNENTTSLKTHKVAVGRYESDLEKAGFISKADDPEDKRAKLVILRFLKEDLTGLAENSNKNSNTNSNSNGNSSSNTDSNSNIDVIFLNLVKSTDIKEIVTQIVTKALKVRYKDALFNPPLDVKTVEYIYQKVVNVTIPVTNSETITNKVTDQDENLTKQATSSMPLKEAKEMLLSHPEGLLLGAFPNFEHAPEQYRPILKNFAAFGDMMEFRHGEWKPTDKFLAENGKGDSK